MSSQRCQGAWKTVKKVLNVISAILMAVLVTVLCVTVFSRITGKDVGLFGFRINVVVTDSMEPQIMVGDIIVSRDYHGQKISTGDVVTYIAPSGEMKGQLITHKVISVNGSGDELEVITQGVKEGATPDPAIGKDDIVSVMLYKTVVFKYIYKILMHPVGFVICIIIPLCATFISELVSLIKQLKKGKEK